MFALGLGSRLSGFSGLGLKGLRLGVQVGGVSGQWGSICRLRLWVWGLGFRVHGPALNPKP